MAAETAQIKRECNIRGYVYIATVSKATGKLRHIAAGCRLWRSFADAHAHYGTGQWSDAAVTFIDSNPRPWARREEARKLLAKLEADVATYAARCRFRKRRARAK